MPHTAWTGRIVHGALAELAILLFPVSCPGCDAPDATLCAECAALLHPAPISRSIGTGLTVWSGVVFEGVAARVVRALKEDGRTPLARNLAPAMRIAAQRAGFDAGIVLVPIPTSRAAFRRRGFRVIELIARRADLPVRRMLRPVRRAADQRGLGVQARRQNVAGAFVSADATGLRVIVIDDVVTTGATLGEAARALRAAGATVVGAATVAGTPRRVAGRRGGSVTSETHR